MDGEAYIQPLEFSAKVRYLPSSSHWNAEQFTVSVSDEEGNRDEVIIYLVSTQNQLFSSLNVRTKNQYLLRSEDRDKQFTFVQRNAFHPELTYPINNSLLVGKVNSSSDSGLKINSGINDVYVTHILAHPSTEDVEGWNWAPNATISLSIGSYHDSQLSNESGGFHFYFDNFDLEPGQLIEISDGNSYDTLLVSNTVITGIDQITDQVFGTAEPFSQLGVFAWFGNEFLGWAPNPIADQYGNWTANFSGIADLRPGVNGGVNQWDEDVDETQVFWDIPSPHILAHPAADNLEVWNLQPNATIFLTIGDYTAQEVSDESGWVYFDLYPYDLVPGDLIEIFDGVSHDEHVVIDFTIDEINVENDTVSGTAEPFSQLAVFAWFENDFLGWAPFPIADQYGNWTANFSGIADLRPGVNGGVNQWDEDGDETQVYWDIPNPRINVYPDDDRNDVYGYEWSPNKEVSLTIDGDYYGSELSNEFGRVYFLDLTIDLEPSMILVMSDGINSRTHTIIDIVFSDINLDLNYVSGTADPGELATHACDFTNCFTLYPIADVSRNWLADFDGLVDIEAGSSGNARQYDAQGNATAIYWHIPLPRIVVYPVEDAIFGIDWEAGNTLILTIGSYSGSLIVPSNGYAKFELAGIYDVQIGDIALMSDGESTKTHTVLNLTITAFNWINDDITGTSQPSSKVTVVAFDNNGPGTMLSTNADASGIWIADFSGYENIKPGTYGDVEQSDENHNYTVVTYIIEASDTLFLPLVVK